jgi:hypothetical protein
MSQAWRGSDEHPTRILVNPTIPMLVSQPSHRMNSMTCYMPVRGTLLFCLLLLLARGSNDIAL